MGEHGPGSRLDWLKEGQDVIFTGPAHNVVHRGVETEMFLCSSRLAPGCANRRSSYLHYSLEVGHAVEIVRGQLSTAIGCPNGSDLPSKAGLYILMLRKLPKDKTRGIRRRLVTRQEERAVSRIRNSTS